MREFLAPTKGTLIAFVIVTILYIMGSKFSPMAPYVPYMQNGGMMLIAIAALYLLACVIIRIKGKNSLRKTVHKGTRNLFEKEV
jgi:hypothetical protein